jgi:hypothetical protein
VKKAVQAAADQIVKSAESQMGQRAAEFQKLKRDANQLLLKLQKLLEAEELNVRVDVKHNPPFDVKPSVSTRRERPPGASDPGDPSLPEGERKILTVCAQYPDGAERDQLTVLTGYKRSSRDTYVQRLRSRGFVEQRGDAIVATADGVAALGSGFEPLPTGEALRAYWIDRLPDGERKVLEVLIALYPDAVDREQIDAATGYKRSSRDTYIQRLGSRRLVETGERGTVKAAADLF